MVLPAHFRIRIKKKLSKYLPFYQYSLAHTFMTFQLGSEKISPHSIAKLF